MTKILRMDKVGCVVGMWDNYRVDIPYEPKETFIVPFPDGGYLTHIDCALHLKLDRMRGVYIRKRYCTNLIRKIEITRRDGICYYKVLDSGFLGWLGHLEEFNKSWKKFCFSIHFGLNEGNVDDLSRGLVTDDVSLCVVWRENRDRRFKIIESGFSFLSYIVPFSLTTKIIYS